MGTRSFAAALVLNGVGFSLPESAAGPWWAVSIALTGLVALGMFARWCRHPHATLLPPVRDGGPARDHARWYCDRCGHEWAAAWEQSSRPVPKFSGFDESKAVDAARRADRLAQQQRALAVQRAGGHAPARPRRPRVTPRPRLAQDVRPAAAMAEATGPALTFGRRRG